MRRTPTVGKRVASHSRHTSVEELLEYMKKLESDRAPDPTFDDLRSVIRQLHAAAEVRNIGLHRSLHDELGGLIVSAAMDVAAAAVNLPAAGPADFRLTRAHKSIMAALDLNRRLSEMLRPSLLDNLGLFAALRWHIKHDCARTSAVCSEQYPDEEIKLTPAATTVLYRIGQESLAMVFAEPNLKTMDFEIKVDHEHFEMKLAHDHLGDEPVDLFEDAAALMHSLNERAKTLGGEMRVARSADGTGLFHRFPIDRIT
jgi:signal transduction histidine kinase